MLQEELVKIIKHIKAGGIADDMESEWLEIKPWPGDMDEHTNRFKPSHDKITGWLREYSVCFANSHGGEVLFGIWDNMRGPDAIQGCRVYDIEKMQADVYNGTSPHLIVEFQELSHDDKTFLVLHAPRSPKAHSTSKGVKYRRVGKDCQPVYPEQDIILEVEKGGDYTSKLLRDVGMEGIDPLEVERLRGWLRRHQPGGAEELVSMSDEGLLKSLGLVSKSRPTVAALLLVGKEEVIREYLPQNEVIFLAFDETGEPTAPPLCLKTGLLNSIERVWEMVRPYNKAVSIKKGFFEVQVESYPEEVVREALLNAVVHRSYIENDSVNVRLYPDRLEIGNPGGFLDGITPNNILTHEPKRRNRLLAEAFQRLGVVNRAGLGVDRIYRALLSVGKPPPLYRDQANAVTIVLAATSFFKEVAIFVGEQGQQGHTWSVEELIIINHLFTHDKIKSDEAAQLLQRSASEASDVLHKMVGSFLEQFGTGRGTHYRLIRKFYDIRGYKTRYVKGKDLEEPKMLEWIREHVRTYGSVTNDETQRICGVNRATALRLLNRLSKIEGFLKLEGKGRGARYLINE